MQFFHATMLPFPMLQDSSLSAKQRKNGTQTQITIDRELEPMFPIFQKYPTCQFKARSFLLPRFGCKKTIGHEWEPTIKKPMISSRTQCKEVISVLAIRTYRHDLFLWQFFVIDESIRLKEPYVDTHQNQQAQHSSMMSADLPGCVSILSLIHI